MLTLSAKGGSIKLPGGRHDTLYHNLERWFDGNESLKSEMDGRKTGSRCSRLT